ncbi:MAG: hypothetical protein Q9227_001604 [Pyrenula ochraceoflavens]
MVVVLRRSLVSSFVRTLERSTSSWRGATPCSGGAAAAVSQRWCIHIQRSRIQWPPSQRSFGTSFARRDGNASASSGSGSGSGASQGGSSSNWKKYSFEEIQELVDKPDEKRILIGLPPSPHPPYTFPPLLIPLPQTPLQSPLTSNQSDVREPLELSQSGRIPTAQNIPITSRPDAMFMPEEEFEERFGFAKPDASKEVIFFCKAGVRSKAAANFAKQAGFGGRFGEFPGSFVEWERRGGVVER